MFSTTTTLVPIVVLFILSIATTYFTRKNYLIIVFIAITGLYSIISEFKY